MNNQNGAVNSNDYIYYLILTLPDGPAQTIPLTEHETVIGRSPNVSQVIVPDPRVSRAHVMATMAADHVTITDLHSANGTRLGSQKLQPNQPVFWARGATIHIGRSTLLLQALDLAGIADNILAPKF